MSQGEGVSGVGAVDEDTVGRLLRYCRELELLLGMLVVKHGEPTDGGFRIAISEPDAARLLLQMGTMEPVVVQRYENTDQRHVIDVL